MNNAPMNVQREFTFQKINSKNNSINNINNHEKDIIDLFHKPNNIKDYNSVNPIRNDNNDFKIKIDNQKEQCCADCSTMVIDNLVYCEIKKCNLLLISDNNLKNINIINNT